MQQKEGSKWRVITANTICLKEEASENLFKYFFIEALELDPSL